MTDSEVEVGGRAYRTSDGVTYTPHSMVHTAVLRMDPTRLELLDGFDRVDAGHMFTPCDSNVRAIVSGREWASKRIMVYGSKSTGEAIDHVETVIQRVRGVGHEAELVDGPDISNIAVNGDFGTQIRLESLIDHVDRDGVDVEYEPEQFPHAIVKLQG